MDRRLRVLLPRNPRLNPDRSSLEWIEARKRHQLSHAHVQMARELGMNPKKLGKIDNHTQEPWKVPLPRFIEELYETRFGKARPEVVITMEQRMAAFRKKKEERRAKKKLAREREGVVPSPAPPQPAPPALAIDDRPEAAALFANLKASKKKLNSLLMKCSGEVAYFDPVYRFYHQSFKVFALQQTTLELVAALQALAPDRKMNPRFRKIVTGGTGKTFELEHNQRWDEVTRPIIEAFFHARFFLECAVRSAKRHHAPPQNLPSHWAALLDLFDLR